MTLANSARLALLAAAVGALAVAGPAHAQQQQKSSQNAPKPAAPAGPGPMPATPPQAPQPNWVKICNTDPQAKKEVCLTSRDVRNDTGQNVASVAIRQVTGEPKKFFLAAVPPGLLLQPGVRVAVDQNQPANGRYSICFPNACYAEVEVNDAFFNALKKGTNLVIQAMNQQAKTINFPVSLAGFSKAYEGPAMDPKVFQAERDKLNEEMNKRAQEARDKLQMQGGAQPPAEAAAPAGGQAPVQAQ